MRRSRRGRRFLTESRYSLSVQAVKAWLFRVEAGSKRRCASLRGRRLRPAQPYGSQKHCPFIFGRSQRRTNIKAEAASKRRCASPPHPEAAGRPLTRGLSCSLSPQSKNQSSAQPTAPAKPHARPSAAGKPITVFPPKTDTAQSSPQFSAPCRPHCGSAFAPPLFRAPGEILSKRASTF